MKITKSLLVIMILLLAVLSLTACGEAEEEKTGFVYIPEYTKLDADVDYMENLTYGADGNIYFSSNELIGRKDSISPEYLEMYGGVEEDWMYEIYGPVLYRMDSESGEVTKLENYQPAEFPFFAEAMEYGQGLQQLSVSDDGSIIILEYGYGSNYENGEWIGENNGYILRVLDNTGAETVQVDLSYLAEEAGYLYFSGMAIDGEGNIYLADGNMNRVLVMDPSGTDLCMLDSPGWIDGLYTLSDGNVYAISYVEGQTLMQIDLAAQDWGKDISIPDAAWRLYPCAAEAEYDFMYNDGSTLMGFDMEAENSSEVLNWIDCDINVDNLVDLSILEDGRIFCIFNTWTEMGSEWESALLTKTDASQVVEKKEIELATIYLDYNLKNEIIEFNKTNPEYRITVTEYHQFNTDEDYTAGLTKLTTEIVSGDVPDILVAGELPLAQYAARGLLEDLYTYVDADPEFDRDDFVPSILSAMESDGNLYMVSPSFYIQTLVGHPSVVGTEMGWTMAEMREVLEASAAAGGTFFPYWTKTDALRMFTMMNMVNYIDWATGECSFDSEEFIELLEFANMFPAEIDWENMEDGDYVDEYQLITEGKIPVTSFSLYDVSEYNMYKALFGGEITFIGYPTSEGVGTRLQLDSGLAMSSKCENKEGAWEFMRMMLTEEYQENYGWAMPTNANMLKKKMDAAMSEESDHSYGIGFGDGNEITVDGRLTQEDVDELYALIDSANGTYSYDEAVLNIINEEAAVFFGGQRSAEETAKNIQSRMNIYVNEQR